MTNKVVIWGLRSNRHSHRYIHEGFYSAFKRLGYDAKWVDDKKSNQRYLEGSNLVIAVNVASSNIKWFPNNRYVVHNFDREDFLERSNVLNLQVFTKTSHGNKIDESIALYSEENRTLSQPWGISEDPKIWKLPQAKIEKVEYWVGAIWNNSLNQGNAVIMQEYKRVLKDHGVELRRTGGTRGYRKTGIKPSKALELVNRSPVGSAIVGDWQRDNFYVPCRLFKNIAAGQIPTSNANFSHLLRDIGFYSHDLQAVVQFALGISLEDKIEIVREAQRRISPYTYEEGINRILEVL